MPATDTLTHKLTTVCRASAPRHDESSSITVKSYWLPLLFRISVLQYSCDCYQTHQTGWTGCGLDTEHPQTPCHIQRYQTSIKFEGMCTYIRSCDSHVTTTIRWSLQACAMDGSTNLSFTGSVKKFASVRQPIIYQWSMITSFSLQASHIIRLCIQYMSVWWEVNYWQQLYNSSVGHIP